MLLLRQLRKNSVKTENVTLRNILFPKESICTKQKLYFRADSSKTSYSSRDNFLKINGKAAFDTYFNELPVVKYHKYCRISSLFLKLRMCGSFVVRVFGVNKDEASFKEACIAEQTVIFSEPCDTLIDISFALGKYDNLYFTLEATDGILFAGEYLCTCEKPERVNIAVVICTYKREEFLLRNHRAITAYMSESTVFDEDSIHFYITDNGRTLKKEDIESPLVSLIPNENTGGSGGFTRGYYEAVHSGREHTHILFMDDDIVLDCEMLLRVYSILRLRKSEYDALAVGGTMIRLSDRITQHEAGSIWDGRRINSIGSGADLTQRDNVFDIAYYPDGNYNAWWFYCFPSDWQEKYGYPLQFFIKEDDIEYSLRCAGDIAVIGGIAVWHDDFDGKYDGFQEYYIKRNELIMTAVSSDKAYTFFQLRKLMLSVMKQTVYQRYFLADIIFRAYGDFLKGWKNFYNTDTALLNTELMNSCKPLLNDAELLEKHGVYFDPDKYSNSLTEKERLKIQALSLNGYLIPSVFYRNDKDGFYMTDLARCRIVNFYKHKRVLHYDAVRKNGFVTEQKKTRLFLNILRIITFSIKFLIKYPSVRKGFREHMAELTRFTHTESIR